MEESAKSTLTDILVLAAMDILATTANQVNIESLAVWPPIAKYEFGQIKNDQTEMFEMKTVLQSVGKILGSL